MKRTAAVCCCVLALGCLAAAYQVHEEPEEDDETVRGKRQQDGVAVIDSIFNIPIAAIKQSSTAAQALSPANAARIDSVLKIPVSTLEAVGALLKNRQEGRAKLQRRSEPTEAPKTPDPRLLEIQRRVEAQREQQRRYHEAIARRRFERMMQHSRRMQEQTSHDEAASRIYRDPYSFNALAKWVLGPDKVFRGHAGHGDGHVYQYFNAQRPLFGTRLTQQGTHRPISVKPTDSTVNASETSSGTTPSSGSSTTAASTTASPVVSTTTTRSAPTHTYEVHEIVDEGDNPFAWPNWFGIINALSTSAKKSKIALNEAAIENKIAPKDEDRFKTKYAEARKKTAEEEITGNEIDGEVDSGEKLVILGN